MKKCFFIFLLVFLFYFKIFSQTKNNWNDTTYEHPIIKYIDCEKRISILDIDTCFINILNTILDRDKTCPYYSKEKSCYLFYVNSLNDSTTYIAITPFYEDKIIFDSKYLKGVIKINNINFYYEGIFNEKIVNQTNYDTLVKYKKPILENKEDSSYYIINRDYINICDGCFYFKEIICSGALIKINAEICDPNKIRCK